MDFSDQLDDAFRKAKNEAVDFLERYNAVHCIRLRHTRNRNNFSNLTQQNAANL